MLPSISFICVNFNGLDHLDPLLESIAGLDYPQDLIEVVLVDNGSKDGSVKFVRGRYPNVKLVCNSKNLGFAKPNNQAAEVATGEYLALINNDMRLAADWLSCMVERLNAAPKDTACVASRILNWDGSHTDFVGGTVSFLGVGFQDHFNVPVDSPSLDDLPTDLPFACGGAMLVNRTAFLEVGGFDEDYFAYVEDVDLGWRLWLMGYRIVYCPEARVYHRHNATSNQFDWWRKFTLLARNSLLTVYKNYEGENLNRILPAVLLLEIKRMAVIGEVPRSEFAFGENVPMAPSSPVRKEALALRLVREARSYGFKHAIKKVIVYYAKKAVVKWGDRASAHALETIPISRRAYASIAAIEDFIDLLPRMREKRNDIQSRRRRSDAEILRVLGKPFGTSENRDEYLNAHWLVLEHFGIKQLIESALENAPLLSEVSSCHGNPP